MQLVAENYWSILINMLMQKYFADLSTICVLWPQQNFDFNLQSSASREIVWLQINPSKLNDAFENNIYNFSRREADDQQNNVFYNQLTKKLIAAIEQSHCEGFVAFQDDIPRFVEAFYKASTFSIWRSMNNRFLFAFSRDQEKKDYFQHNFFRNQAHILVAEADFQNSSIFDIKTNKFVGPKSNHPEQFIGLSTFYGLNQSFEPALAAFAAGKLSNLKGREIVVGAFDYRPFVAVDFQRLPLYHDRAADNPSHLVHVDGTEIRISHVFCEVYNCTLHFDTTEKGEWGWGFSNYSGCGMIGLIIEDKIQMAFGAMYQFYSAYAVVDMTAYLGRSGATCLVPIAATLASWDLPLRPFELSLWLAVMAALCLEVVLLFGVRKFEHNLANAPSDCWSCLKFGCVTALKLFVNQSSSYLVQSHTVRTFLFACYMFDIILTSMYGAGLSAVLTLPTLGESADSVEKLVQYNLPWTGSSYAWLEIINNAEGEENIYTRLVNNFELNSMDEMRSKAQQANMGFIVESLAFGHFGGGDFFTPLALQRLKLMTDDIYSQFTVAMVSRLWPHLEKYNDFVLQWHASGLDKFWEWKSTAVYLNANEQNQVEASKYNSLAHDGPAKLNTQNFAGIIVLWMVGIILSMVIFGIEIIWFKLLQ